MPGRIEIQRVGDFPESTAVTAVDVSVSSQGTVTTQEALPSSPPASERARQTPVRNRRLRYLATHPTYFTSPDLELADPLLYDTLIRSYQSPSEREAEGRSKGWSGILAADLERSEAKLSAIRDPKIASLSPPIENDNGDPISTKEEGQDLWKKIMTLRFLEGKDGDVDYEAIDNSDEWDDWAQIERDRQDSYFDAETPTEGQGNGDTGVQDF